MHIILNYASTVDEQYKVNSRVISVNGLQDCKGGGWSMRGMQGQSLFAKHSNIEKFHTWIKEVNVKEK